MRCRACILAAWLYAAVDADVFRILIGAICLAFVAFQMARSGGWLAVPAMPFSAPYAWIAGMVSGFTSFVSHAGGPPAAVFMLSQGLGKTTFQATTVVDVLGGQLDEGRALCVSGHFQLGHHDGASVAGPIRFDRRLAGREGALLDPGAFVLWADLCAAVAHR